MKRAIRLAAAVVCLFTAILAAAPMAMAQTDDHGNTRATATVVPESSTIAGNLETGGDKDYFRIEHARVGLLQIHTTGTTDTYGTLFWSGGSIENNDSAVSTNFSISVPKAQADTYYVEVKGYSTTTSGAYELDVVFESEPIESESNIQTLPLVLPVTDGGREGFVRIVNLSGESGTVSIHAIDDAGVRFGPITMDLAANGATHFRSRDLEQGNVARGIPSGIGDGEGNWRLEFESDLDFGAMAYIRTSDGFLTSMHDKVPETAETHHVVFSIRPATYPSKAGFDW